MHVGNDRVGGAHVADRELHVSASFAWEAPWLGNPAHTGNDACRRKRAPRRHSTSDTRARPANEDARRMEAQNVPRTMN
jgi:hypothetical protein